MRKLTIPEALKTEFASVEAIWDTSGETRRVDALVLSWVKYEKQLRRLFSFLVFHHPKITASTLDAVMPAFRKNRNLYQETFISVSKGLGFAPLPKLSAVSSQNPRSEITGTTKNENKH